MGNKVQTIFDLLFQNNSLRKEEKQEFVRTVVKIMDNYGFQKVTKIFGGNRKYYKAVRFEKPKGNNIGQWLEVVFDKYGSRRFYITVGHSETIKPNKHLFVGHVGRRKKENQDWWGAQWYSISRKRAWIRDTRYVSKHLPNLVAYLDTAKNDDGIHCYIGLGNIIPKR